MDAWLRSILSIFGLLAAGLLSGCQSADSMRLSELETRNRILAEQNAIYAEEVAALARNNRRLFSKLKQADAELAKRPAGLYR